MKKCTKCGIAKEVEDFHKDKSRSDGLTSGCKSCKNQASRAWRAANPERNRESIRRWEQSEAGRASMRRRGPINTRKMKYGLTQSDYERLLEAQHHLCAICGSEGPLNIDHCHSMKQVRGLLCHHCNILLGMARDDVDVLASAMAYLLGKGGGGGVSGSPKDNARRGHQADI